MRPSSSLFERTASSWICPVCRRSQQSAVSSTKRAFQSRLNTQIQSSTRSNTARPGSARQARVLVERSRESLVSKGPSLAGRCFSTTARARASETTAHTSQSRAEKEEDGQKSSLSAAAAAAAAAAPTQPAYYALFPKTLPLGSPPAGPFEIDTKALRREFLQLQAAAHPDLHHAAATDDDDDDDSSSSTTSSSGGSATNPRSQYSVDRRQAEAISSHINAAYKTLLSPLLRAQYLLQEKYGLDLEADESGVVSSPDPELLMEVLSAREMIEEAESEADLEGVQRENDERIAECEYLLGEAFRSDDVESAKREAVRLRFWVNIGDSIRNWERGVSVVLQH